MMSKEITDFIETMHNKGREVVISGNYVIIKPTDGLSVADIMQLQRLNKKDALYKYLKTENKPSK